MVVEGLIKLIQSPPEFLFQFEVLSGEDFGFLIFEDSFWLWPTLSLNKKRLKFVSPRLILDLQWDSFGRLLPGFRKWLVRWLTQCGDAVISFVCELCNLYLRMRWTWFHLQSMIFILFRNQLLVFIGVPRFEGEGSFPATMWRICFSFFAFVAVFPAIICRVRHSFPATTCRSSKLWVR